MYNSMLIICDMIRAKVVPKQSETESIILPNKIKPIILLSNFFPLFFIFFLGLALSAPALLPVFGKIIPYIRLQNSQ